MSPKTISILVAALAVGIVLSGSIYTVDETKQVVLTQFGQRIGKPITTPGLNFKMPFTQKANFFEKRVLEWDGPSVEMATREKVYITVDAFARWRISDPGVFFERLRDERSARSRLNDILGSESQSAVARHDLIELIRTTKGALPVNPELATPAGGNTDRSSVRIGRPAIEKMVQEASVPKLANYGIELLDFNFKRINYTSRVSEQIYARMVSEREQIAERYRSEGAGEAAKILGNRDKDLLRIESEAYKKVQEIQGEADAKATEIYARAYNASPEAQELFGFVKSMDTYKTILGPQNTLILTTESDLFRFLKSSTSTLGSSPSLERPATPASPAKPRVTAPAATPAPAPPVAPEAKPEPAAAPEPAAETPAPPAPTPAPAPATEPAP